MNHDVPEVTGNRAARRSAARRGRKLAALGSGAVLATGVAASAMAAFPSAAGAATIPVSNTNDSGAGSLREALANANAGDTIDLTGISGTITLASQLDIEDAVTIQGPGASALTISGNNATRVFSMDGDYLGGGTLTISGVTIANGNVDGPGAGVFVNCDGGTGSLVLDGTVVTGNTADDLGAGLYFDVCHGDSNVTIVNSVVSNNTSTGSGGGGIWFDEGNTLTIQDSTLSGNHAAYRGGALYFDDGTSLVVISSTLSDNHAGEGERQSGWGGAIVLSRLTGDALIANSTISGNTVTGFGGGIAVLSGNLDLEQATISGNTATSGGDGLYFGYGGDETATSAARQRQGASGPSAQDAESGAITGSIVAGNGDGSEDLSSDFNGGFPVDATSSVLGGTSFVNVSGEGNQTGVTNPGLAPLANNGGPTQTMALLAGSPAIDAGPATVPDFPGNEFDQRGPGFPRVVNGKVDVGAYEVQPAPAPAPAPEVVVTPKFTG